jgi:vitamin K-dependent gamma-carboxylase
MTERLDTLIKAGLQPVDGRSLAVFRILLGTIMALAMARYIANGWLDIHYLEPRFFFKFSGLEWVLVPGKVALYTLAYSLLGLASCIALGLFTRPALMLFFLGFAYFEAMDVTNYLNHYVLVLLLVLQLTLTPCGRTWSLDNWRLGRAQKQSIPAWCLWMLRLQIGVVYCSASIAKLGSDWLLHGQPLGIWLAARGHLPLIGWLQQFAWVPLAMSWCGFLFDLCAPFLLLWRRSRRFTFPLVVVFHGLTYLLFDIGVFPFLMTAAATLFFAPDWPKTFSSKGSFELPPPPRVLVGNGLRLVAVAALLVLLLQVSFPQRHLLQGGNVLWHEQGMRFSWRVMLREKNGAISYRVRDKASGKTWQVPPARYLNMRQEAEFSGQPDLIVQLAQHIAEDFRRKGRSVEVRAETLVSLNGRSAVPMINPLVDLSQPLPAGWILAAPTGAPHSAKAGRR